MLCRLSSRNGVIDRKGRKKKHGTDHAVKDKGSARYSKRGEKTSDRTVSGRIIVRREKTDARGLSSVGSSTKKMPPKQLEWSADESPPVMVAKPKKRKKQGVVSARGWVSLKVSSQKFTIHSSVGDRKVKKLAKYDWRLRGAGRARG